MMNYSDIKVTVGDLKKSLEKFSDNAKIDIYCNEDLDMSFFVTDTEPIEINKVGKVRIVETDRTEILYKGIKNG